MKISYVTTYDALDIHNWSGTGYFIAKALENQSAEITYLGNLASQHNLPARIKKMLYYLIGKKFQVEREPFIAKQCAKQILNSLKADTDIIFSPGSTTVALLDTKKPKVFYTDATFAGMIGFYDGFSNLCRETIKNGNYLEQAALETSNLAIYSSEWAAKTAIDNYNVNPEKIKVVPFGANIECNRDLKKIKEVVTNRSNKECHLLFMGGDWIRKGGDLAIKVAKALNELGLKTKLHIVGIKNIPLDQIPDFIINHGFISKSTQDGKDKIDKLMAGCHFLLLPSKADCTPIVYSEACSFGLPSITSSVGGIPTIIKDDVNGKTFSLSSNEIEYANYILSVFSKSDRYQELAYSSYNEYEQRLNWKITGAAIMQLLKEL